MNHARVRSAIVLLGLLVFFGSSLFAADPAPAEVAYTQFQELRNKAEAPSAARFDAVARAGLQFLVTFPNDRRTDAVLDSLGNFSQTLRGKENDSQRSAWNSYLALAILDPLHKEGISADQRAVLIALQAVVAAAAMRENGARENVSAARERIFELAALPEGSRFLVRAERSFLDALRAKLPKSVGPYLERMSKDPNVEVARFASNELKIYTAKTTPLEMTVTAIDGTAVDFALLRKMHVILFFWDTKDAASDAHIEALRKASKDYSKKRLQIVTVILDKGAGAKEAVSAAAAAKKIPGVVVFDGEGLAGPVPSRFAISRSAYALIFDIDGKLVAQIGSAKSYESELSKRIQ